MNKEFIPYEEALALKELGFDEPCFAYYTDKESKFIPASYSQEGTEYPTNSDLIQDWISAPLWQQAFRWFREKYGYQHSIDIDISLEDFFTIKHRSKGIIYESKNTYKSYEEVELACLRKLIEIVKGKR